MGPSRSMNWQELWLQAPPLKIRGISILQHKLQRFNLARLRNWGKHTWLEAPERHTGTSFFGWAVNTFLKLRKRSRFRAAKLYFLLALLIAGCWPVGKGVRQLRVGRRGKARRWRGAWATREGSRGGCLCSKGAHSQRRKEVSSRRKRAKVRAICKTARK